MPMYSYKCPTCARRWDIFKPLAELNRVELCGNCNFAMNRQVVAPMVRGDYAGYKCPITGSWVEGRRAHEENLRKHGCRVLESGETEAVKRNRAASEAALDASVEATVEEFFETLPTEKKERLAAEVESGADTVLTRN